MNYLQPEERTRTPGLNRWARLRADIPTTLRRGGWYQVLSAGPEEAVLEVRGAPVVFARDVVEIVHARPQAWSLVPANWGGPYLVCPDCAERVHAGAVTGQYRCPRCRGSFAVGAEHDIAS